MIRYIFTGLVLLSASSFAFAVEQLTQKIDSVLKEMKPPQATSTDDVDALITNPKMRADTGSRSRYSLSASLGYNGGSLARPLENTRPNITDAAGTTDFALLAGTVSSKYNFDTRHSLIGGVGVRWVAPLAGSETPSGYIGDRAGLSNPYAIYQYIYRLFDLQSSVQIRQSLITDSDQVHRGAVSSGGFSQSSVIDLGTSRFSLGFTTYIGYAFYNSNKKEYMNQQSDYSWGLGPALEYKISDRWNLHLDTNLLTFEHLRSVSDAWTFRRQAVSQNLTFGYSLTRDIFISPGVSFVITNLRADRTTWSVSAAINVF